VYFNQFNITTEGCIYDKIIYDFSIVGSGGLPSFIVQNRGNISIQISTNKKTFAGVYKLQLTGGVNPDHFVSAPITLTLTPFPYPNTNAPKLTSSIE